MSASESLFDAHCHLDVAAFDGDRDAVVARARAAGVGQLVIPAIYPRDWEKLAATAARYEGAHFCLGIHPQVLPELGRAEVDEALARLERTARALGPVALGETGFDRGVADAGVPFERQAEVFDAHVEIARTLDLPVVLHILGAHGEALERLAKHGPLRAGGVVHSMSGAAELVDAYVALDLHLSFAGSVTRPGAKKPKKAVARVPDHRLLVETDAPDQTPTGAPSDRNEPSYLPRIVRAVAEARGESESRIAELTTRNARAVYRLDPSR